MLSQHCDSEQLWRRVPRLRATAKLSNRSRFPARSTAPSRPPDVRKSLPLAIIKWPLALAWTMRPAESARVCSPRHAALGQLVAPLPEGAKGKPIKLPAVGGPLDDRFSGESV
jgi:hypothetical protein